MNKTIGFKNINRLAVPAIIAGIAEPLLSITDTAIVGNIPEFGTESLAAVGIVGSFLSALIWILGQTRSAISAIISQYLGAGKIEEVKTLPAQAIFFNVALSVVLLLSTVFFVEEIFKLYNASGLILEYCVEYYDIRVWGFPLTLFTFAVFGIFRGLQNTFWPMIVALIGALTNIGLDFVLVYGIEDVIPAMGIRGAAWASLISQFIMAILVFVLLVVKTNVSLKLKFPLNKELGRLVTMSLNLFVRSIALNTALYFATANATKYGDEYIAAYTISMNIWMFTAFFIDGYGAAGNILSGKLLGAKDYKSLWKLAKRVSTYGIMVSLVLALFGFVFYRSIGQVFTTETLVLETFYSVFFIVLIVQPINGLAFVFDGVFKGLGEMSYLRNVLLGATFLAFIPTLYLCNFFDLKLYGIWIAFSTWALFRGITLILKFRKKFKSLSL
ncbi:MATE family efflux transporter [Aquimarina sp. AD10]|uniref:MATE family efflux transporter n=1 Tax=Aquimarina sp. AD10 TaxID=1714849 RepID=UPI000E483332|nr:MATE family efflux transporter [Aquimarina sp. AD10]AXT61991.1 MATE family efflux transporter [Aquimarina sp. AD10]RKN02450.1 MATE family efflux transporter [Aquimarina sp. AD10]